MEKGYFMRSLHRKSIREWFYLENHKHWFGVTLTLKQMVNGVRLDEIISSQNLRHFLNILNKSTFGNRFKRFGKTIDSVPVLEKSKTDRFHFHMCLRKPDEEEGLRFEHRIRDCWLKTRWGYNEIYVNREIDNGWIDYITKSDDIDWNNVHRDH